MLRDDTPRRLPVLHAPTVSRPADPLTIRDVDDAEGYRHVERLQRAVWGFSERSVVPAHVLYVAASSGGILLGAYDGETPVGFALGFLGEKEGRRCHVSHMLGVLPAYQGRGVGAAIKQRQRERATAQGHDLMVWTFDPLEAANAHLNLTKLGARSRTYYPDLYGNLGNRLNRGLPTDRLLVEWELRTPLTAHPGPGVPLLGSRDGWPERSPDGMADGQPLTIAIPPSIQRLKQENPALARQWRKAVREAFIEVFDRGYAAVEFRDGAYLLAPEVKEEHR
jgi:predicted GNAT superfamily acetyltransferase